MSISMIIIGLRDESIVISGKIVSIMTRGKRRWRERERDRATDRQTDRQTGRQRC